MAKITIRGKQQPIEVSYSEANEIKELLNGSENSNSKIITVGHLTIRLSEIKGIEDDVHTSESDLMFNVDDPNVRIMLRNFEKELEVLKIKHSCSQLLAFEWWCIAKGYYLNPVYEEHIRPDGTKWIKPETNKCRSDVNIAWEMRKSLHILQAKTRFAKKMEVERLDSLEEKLKEQMDVSQELNQIELNKLF